MKKSGNQAALLFFVNRPDGRFFTPAKHIDPKYYDGLLKAKEEGVLLLAYRAKSSLKEMKVGKPVPIHLH